jgi:hypothetical protein
MSADARWLDDPPLPELAPPPAQRILVRGAQVVRVHFTDEPNEKQRGHIEVVVIAWARLPGGDWAGLCVWLAAVRKPGPRGTRTTGGGRYGWLRMLPDRVQSWRPPRPYLADPDEGWHGQGEPGEVSAAIERAAATLPEEVRERAVRPMDVSSTDGTDP